MPLQPCARRRRIRRQAALTTALSALLLLLCVGGGGWRRTKASKRIGMPHTREGSGTGGMKSPDLERIRKLPGNDACVECSVSKPQWASLTYATLLCLECAGKHRGMGVEMSFVRSLTLDAWSDPEVQLMLHGGNQRFLDHCESCKVPRWLPLHLKYKNEHTLRYKKALEGRFFNLTGWQLPSSRPEARGSRNRHSTTTSATRLRPQAPASRFEGLGRHAYRPSSPFSRSVEGPARGAEDSFQGIAGGRRAKPAAYYPPQGREGDDPDWPWLRGDHQRGGSRRSGMLQLVEELWGEIVRLNNEIQPLEKMLAGARWIASKVTRTTASIYSQWPSAAGFEGFGPEGPLPSRKYPHKWADNVNRRTFAGSAPSGRQPPAPH
eukprot:CAMPEP_0114525462 /NCGR_PEP_ID=MMETSP0109-20121206/22437_1 /TAXON_ID=29199 /ORGANISM="Chlorarachnion reptans, Strain CCCM449" /LENGTH=378 /DNA_ID=CAMNT_0001707045 /DNA_START=41 /DNA_END=1177 /DNA_ORIENTATION=-